MYANRVSCSRLIVLFFVVGALAAAAPRVEAQAPTTQGEPVAPIPAQEQHQHQPPAQPPTDHAPGAVDKDCRSASRANRTAASDGAFL